MIEKLLERDPDYAWTFLSIIAGLIVFPYGTQKLLGMVWVARSYNEADPTLLEVKAEQ